jgi:glutamyl-tRNA synthetase
MSKKAVRVRFAPAPTGHLHVGGARTALFNFLFARRHKGTFILRLEDTDPARSSEEYYHSIITALEWLGLEWDEGPEVGGKYGPYRQSERRAVYDEYLGKLRESGRAYECFCTPEELDERRERMRAAGEAPRYDGRCSDLSAEERERLAGQGLTPCLRFRLDADADLAFDDLIRGRVEIKAADLDDFVIARPDGSPTYNFVCAVDDATMAISHVIRGEDHISNTPRQIAVSRALGFESATFAHVPLLLGPDKSRLSKRHGAKAVSEYKEEGYLPEAFVNFLALLGWSYDDEREIFTLKELKKAFSLERVVKKGAVFDVDKLTWMNGV